MNESGFKLSILMIVVILAFGTLSYLSLKNSQALQIPIWQQIQDKSKENSSYEASQIPAEIVITKNGFIPAAISIIVGQQVTFVNQDVNAHKIVPYPFSDSAALPALDSEVLQPTDSFTYSFEKKGTYILTENINWGKYKVTVIVN